MTMKLVWPLRSPDEMARQRALLSRLAAFFRRIDATPLVPVCLEQGAQPIWCKLEFLNPSGSTSIALAMVCAQLGLRFSIVMPEGVAIPLDGPLPGSPVEWMP